MTEEATEIAILGAGIAGLALALHLHRHRISCKVYEAAPELRELGVGITLLPHAMREIAALRLDREIAAGAIETRESAFFNRFGQKIYAEPRGRLAGYDFAEMGIQRGRLHAILLAAVRERLGGAAVVTGHRCVGVEQDCESVSIAFANGASARAAAAIACDGINSAVRQIYYPNEDLAFAGINTWRGVTRRAPILDGRTYMRVGSIKTGKMVIYPVADFDDGTQLINWVAEIESPQASPNDWNRAVEPSALLPLFADWSFDWLDVPALVSQAQTIIEYPMVDRDPIDRWTFGRATLCGDAAHPMYPRGSNGSAQALIDVRVLSEQLAREHDPRIAFESYEAQRRPLTTEIVRTNRTAPPDAINLEVERRIGDRPFENLDEVITQDELRAISEGYKRIAGFALQDMATET